MNEKIGNFEHGFIGDHANFTPKYQAASCFSNIRFVRGKKSFEISPGRTPDKIWIATELEEGGEFDAGAFFNILEKFYGDNF